MAPTAPGAGVGDRRKPLGAKPGGFPLGPCRTRATNILTSPMTTAKFPLGQVVATPGALRALAAAGRGPVEFLARHAAGDWGELCADDRKENDLAREHGSRIFSAYRLPDGTKIWIITEADRSATTILLPEEY